MNNNSKSDDSNSNNEEEKSKSRLDLKSRSSSGTIKSKPQSQSHLKTLYCIDYPGFVVNSSEAIHTLGGMDRVEQAFQRGRSSGKLLLNYTPENIFTKMLGSNTLEDVSACHHDNSEVPSGDEQHGAGDFEHSPKKSEPSLSSHDITSNNNSNNRIAPMNSNNNVNDLLTMPCLLMTVKSKKSKNKRRKTITSVQLTGKVTKIFNFQKISDFQYLPMSSTIHSADKSTNNTDSNSNSNNNNTTASQTVTFNAFYDNFLFNDIGSYDEELRKKTLPQLFVLPPFFSRFDDPTNYAFRSEPTKKQQKTTKERAESSGADSPKKHQPSSARKEVDNDNDTNDDREAAGGESGGEHLDESGGENLEDNEDNEIDELNNSLGIDKNSNKNSTELIRSMRQERSSQAILVTFKDKQVPSKPSDGLRAPRNETIRHCVQTLNSMFADRPCYLKSVLLCVTEFSPALLKEALPYCAYYFTTGPWRSCWVRFGYDPRLEPSSKIYQMIDYRLRYYSEPEQKVKAKPRSSYHKRKFRSDLSESEQDDYKQFKIETDMYKFKGDKLPPSRNVFYQICDIDDEDVQKLIKRGSSDLMVRECSEKDGWCSKNIQNNCRDLMSQKHERLSKSLALSNKKH